MRAHVRVSQGVNVDAHMLWCMCEGQRTTSGFSSQLLPCLKQGLIATVHTGLAPGDSPVPPSRLLGALEVHMLTLCPALTRVLGT